MRLAEQIKLGLCKKYIGMDDLTDDMLENSKKHTVMYSGGHDCTLILLALCELKQKDIIKGDIQIIHCMGVCSEAKDKAEEIAINKILKYIKKKFNTIVQVIKISIRPTYELQEVPFHVGYVLQYLYLVNSYHLFDNNACVYVGSIGDDPDQIKLPYIKNILDNLGMIRSNKINFITPIYSYDKEKVITELLENYPEVMNMLVTCEFPKKLKNNHIKPCEKCEKCMELKQALSSVFNNKSLQNTKTKELIKITNERVQKELEELNESDEIKLDK